MYGLLLGIMLAAGIQAQSRDCEVMVATRVGLILPSGMLPDAIRQAVAMFRDIGIRLKFVGAAAPKSLHACAIPIVVQIQAFDNHPVPADSLAYALPYQQSGTAIHVFADRVLRNPNRAFSRTLLAHIMVHEITHVLQRVSRHSESGIMKAQWSAADYQRMERTPLPFTPEDVLLIRQGLATRAHIAIPAPPMGQ